MCGTVGMFVGCQAMAYCPRLRVLGTSGQDTGGTSPAAGGAGDITVKYRSPLENWHERATIRTAPRRRVGSNSGDRFFFSPDLVPVARHPLVCALPDSVFREILVQHLYRYLDFTAKLESIVVNRTVLGIAQGSVGVEIPSDMRFDAYKIYCDEAYHTLFSADLARQVNAVTGVAPRLPARPFFLRRLAEIQSAFPASDRMLIELLFVVISETLISATLAEVPDSANVVAAVRETVSDHASDEGRHHAYFATFLRFLWGQLSQSERSRAAHLVPRLADAFLRPDLAAIREELAMYGMRGADIDVVLADVFRSDLVGQHRSMVARQTLRHFADLGAFATVQSQEELSAYGFKVPGRNVTEEYVTNDR